MKTSSIVTVRFEKPDSRETIYREVTIDHRKVQLHTGTVTLEGEERPYHSETIRFTSEADAQTFFDTQVEHATRTFKTTARTSREVERIEPRPHAHASNPQLEASVTTAKESRVYADWLQSNGDLRGELAALHQRGETEVAERFLEANLPSLFEAIEAQLDTGIRKFQWRDGFLVGATLQIDDGSDLQLHQLTQQFLALPIARFVSELHFVLASNASDDDWGPTMNAITSWAHAGQIAGLFVNEYDSEDRGMSWVGFGDFSEAWAKLPSLQTLHICSGQGGTLGALNLPKLRTFIRESGGLQVGELEAIITAQWPMLERLDIWFGQSNYQGEGTVEHGMRIVASAPASLRQLGLINSEFAPALITPLAASPVLGQLTVLDLSKGTLVDADVDLFLAHREAFRHLQRLDLSQNLFNTRGAELQAALPNVVLGTQRYGEYANEEHRYSAVGE